MNDAAERQRKKLAEVDDSGELYKVASRSGVGCRSFLRSCPPAEANPKKRLVAPTAIVRFPEHMARP
jgi:hypothetical protein